MGKWVKMKDIKYCCCCGKIISNVNEADWYSHISIKYCAACRKKSDREKTAIRVAALRKRKKEKDKFRDEQLILLQIQNELLEKRIIELREHSFQKIEST